MNLNPAFTFANDFSMGSDGFFQLFPYGSFPGVAIASGANGALTRFDSVQVLDRVAADQLVSNFYSAGRRIKSFVRGLPIYAGHPDMPGGSTRYADKTEKGLVAELEARAGGLYAKPVFSNAAEPLLNGSRKIFASGYWSAVQIADTVGKRAYRPDILKSVGLTDNPNLPVVHLNSAEINSPRASFTNAGERSAWVKQLVAEEMELGVSYDQAFARVQRQNPSLFASMRQPSNHQ